MIVDSHHHFLAPARFVYPWMNADTAAIARAFEPADLTPLLADAGVSATVLVQTLHDPAETSSMLAVAAERPWIAGVVAWIDLTRGDVAEQIARVRELHGGGRLAGIRHLVHEEPDEHWLGRPDVRAGLAVLARAGLPFDLLLRPRELPAALACARSLAELRFVVDHLAKPCVRLGPDDPANAGWFRDLRSIAALPHVVCKLSGLVTEAAWDGWTVAALRPFAEHALACFGAERMLFGSDWPVCTLAAGYGEVVAAARALTADLSGAEHRAIFAGNARRTYGLALCNDERND